MMNAPDFGDALLSPKIIEDLTDDDFGMIRYPDSSAVEVAVAHDGTREGVRQAETIARLIINALQLRDLLFEATYVWADLFDAPPDVDGHVSGADLVEWFAQWRLKAKAALADVDAVNALPLEDGVDGT
jgi:hypothetical protein